MTARAWLIEWAELQTGRPMTDFTTSEAHANGCKMVGATVIPLFTSPQPEGLGIEVTDEMVERACAAYTPDIWKMLQQPAKAIFAEKMHAALTAALQPKE